MSHLELALGSVQFGMKYGVAGRGEAVPDVEVREILAHAYRWGVRLLDTAPVYGDVESRLAALAGDLDFSVISKVPALPPDCSADAAVRSVTESIARSRERLGPLLRAVLFHHGEDLLGPHGAALWAPANALAQKLEIQLGVSCYEPEAVGRVRAQFPISIAQIPGSAFDQRLGDSRLSERIRGVEIHLRSVFLQGLLLMPAVTAIERVPAAAQPLAMWSRWCAERNLRPLRAALSIAKGLPSVRYCVVGVDRLAQLEEIMTEWERAMPMSAPELAQASPEVMDPRRWMAA